MEITNPQLISKRDLKKQFIKLTKKYHPDINPLNKDKYTLILETYQ